jgi:hypothetical protein
MRVKTETEGKTKDVGLLDVTPENFIVPKGEENFYHCRIEVVKFNQETGERISRPRMQIFGKKFFETFGLHNLRKMGYKVDIMHDPNVWEAANKEKIEANKRAKAEAAAKAATAAKAAEREKMKAEIIAELTASGVIPTEPKKAGRKPKAEKTAEAEEAAGDSPENNENV